MKRGLTIALGGLAALALPIMLAQAAEPTRPAPLATTGDAAPRPWKRYTGWPTRDTAKFSTLANTQASPPAPK